MWSSIHHTVLFRFRDKVPFILLFLPVSLLRNSSHPKIGWVKHILRQKQNNHSQILTLRSLTQYQALQSAAYFYWHGFSMDNFQIKNGSTLVNFNPEEWWLNTVNVQNPNIWITEPLDFLTKWFPKIELHSHSISGPVMEWLVRWWQTIQILDRKTNTVGIRKPNRVWLSNSTFDGFQIRLGFEPFETRTSLPGFEWLA